MKCSCAHNTDGSVTTMLCPQHADTDPCLTMARVTGKRRHGSIVRGVCTACGWRAADVRARIEELAEMIDANEADPDTYSPDDNNQWTHELTRLFGLIENVR